MSQQWRIKLHALRDRIVEETFREMSRNPQRRYYLWFKPATRDAWGDLAVTTEDLLHPWALLCDTPIPNHVTKDQLYAWFNIQLRHAPIIGPETERSNHEKPTPAKQSRLPREEG